jgi:hypothetical protein
MSMKRTIMAGVSAAVLAGSTLIAAPALAEGAPPAVPPHGHMLVLGVQYNQMGAPIGFRKCVDVAAGRFLPLNAHHDHLHTGAAGTALRERAGHLAVPTVLSGFANCAELEAVFR